MKYAFSFLLLACFAAAVSWRPVSAQKQKPATRPQHPSSAKKQSLSARQIAQRAWTAIKLDGVEMISTLTIISARGHRRVRRTAAISKLFNNGRLEKKLLRFFHPPDVRGTSFLSFDYKNRTDVLWVYLPALRKTRRIVSSDKAKNFMGSEFTYADITPPSVNDFRYKLLGQETKGQILCWKLLVTPRNQSVARENGYAKRLVWVGQKDYVLRRAANYDLKGRLHKILTASNIRLLDKAKGRYRPLLMKIANQQNKRASIMQVDKIRLRPNIPNRYFTTRFLERH